MANSLRPLSNILKKFQEITATKAVSSTPVITRPVPQMSSLKDAKAVVEEGGSTIWGQLPDFPFKSDKFGLGFTSSAQKVVRRARVGGPPVKISHQGINSLEDSEEEGSLEDWICPTVDGGLCNWEAKDFVLITFILQ